MRTANSRENKVVDAQEPVRAALEEYLERYPNKIAAADTIGVSLGDLYNWCSGYRRIPEWMCEVLGYRKAYVRFGDALRVTTTGKTA
jgi:hypothetical protein